MLKEVVVLFHAAYEMEILECEVSGKKGFGKEKSGAFASLSDLIHSNLSPVDFFLQQQ